MSSHRSELPPAVHTIGPICDDKEDARRQLIAYYDSGYIDLLKLGATIKACDGAMTRLRIASLTNITL
jgi:hypothetical protein